MFKRGKIEVNKDKFLQINKFYFKKEWHSIDIKTKLV